MDREDFEQVKQEAREVYTAQASIYNPYFKDRVFLGSQGFRHLQFKEGKERPENEQRFKFRFLSLGLEVIKASSTIQEYRELFVPVGKKEEIENGTAPIKRIRYWGMIAILGEKNVQVKAVIRQIGDGKIEFWSVMPYNRIKGGSQKIYEDGIEED